MVGLVMSLSPVPLKTHHVGARCTLNPSEAQTSSRWGGGVTFGKTEDPMGTSSLESGLFLRRAASHGCSPLAFSRAGKDTRILFANEHLSHRSIFAARESIRKRPKEKRAEWKLSTSNVHPYTSITGGKHFS
ncbi:hypothetical protein TNCV_4769641 [Trichonephila clavipes]|nr:hypothetical protein TNCV_4769641 [Trichonephila clavipes]